MTDRESVERIRTYVEYPYTSPGTVVLNSALVRLTARDLAQLLEERDALLAENEKLRAELTVARHDLRDANVKVMRVAQERDELRAPTLAQALQVPEVREMREALCEIERLYYQEGKDLPSRAAQMRAVATEIIIKTHDAALAVLERGEKP